jgi:hypothetical protein
MLIGGFSSKQFLARLSVITYDHNWLHWYGNWDYQLIDYVRGASVRRHGSIFSNLQNTPSQIVAKIILMLYTSPPRLESSVITLINILSNFFKPK